MITLDFLNKEVFKDLNKEEKLILKNQNTNFMISMIVDSFQNGNESIFAILPNLYEAQKAYDDISNILKEEDVLFYPADELVASELLDVAGDFKYERINTLVSLIEGKKKYVVVTNLNGAIKLQMNREIYQSHFKTIDMSTSLNESKFYQDLEEMGYQFSYTVTKTGQYSHRGSIIDIFPLNYERPIRLDLVGDEIETIKEFDLESQKSIGKIESFKIIPVTEMIYNNENLSFAVTKVNDLINKSKSDAERERLNQDILRLNNRNGIDNLTRYIRYFDNNPETIFDLVDAKKIYLIDYKKAEDTFNHMIDELKEFSEDIGGYSVFELDYFKDFHYLERISNVISEGVIDSVNDGLDLFVTVPDSFKAQEAEIVKYLKSNYKAYTVICLIRNQIRLDHLKEALLENDIFFSLASDCSHIKPGQVNIVLNEYLPTFKLSSKKIIVLNESTLFEVKYQNRRPKYKSIYKNTTKISHYDELELGDYVVHFDYGIGKYLGLKTMEANGIKRDYIQIEYDKSDTLYIPLEQINRIEKYSAGDVANVKLTHLGTKQWTQAKEKVAKRIRDISQELIRLYAHRQASLGFACLPDTNDQVLFEADFGYDLTLDQAKAITEIKHEMETPRVMDRLVCGDVGYGKTEVALRAAFKAIESGKQVAVLAPTTILSRQHYYTFKNRMERFGIRVDLLNRLQSAKNVKKTLADLAAGSVDCVIGTHKLLGKDIKFHDLGLLVVDEEQRFGVLQKERIKELKINVDTLTLSATPIPRTLQMSMVGIKELSMLETPPKNRYPVQTYVLERNDSVIRDAIMREMARHGQVFYMYNYTESILEVKRHLEALVPDARICVGHGKMEKNELENVITAFIDKEYDVLLCTTIIETGIDMPDANTLIIHDSNRLGLSQLYQLRGRVGRSDKIAYAYLMYEPHKILSEDALKRLETIKEFNELGSGFKIAMRDLAIRGAGDLLGDSQSGFIESVGLETYLHILDEELKNTSTKSMPELEEKKDLDPSLNQVYASRSISDNYINNEDVKIEIHKKIDRITSLDSLKELSEELHDRFGDYDDTIEVYMYEKLLNSLCKQHDVKKILDTKSQMILFMSEATSNKMDGNKIFALANETSKDINLHYYNKQIEIIMNKNGYKNNGHIIVLVTYLDKIFKNS